MLGASLYLSQSEEMNMQNLKVLNEVGVKTIFTSLHIPEEDPEQTLSGLKRITGKIKNYGMNLMADVSSSTLEQYSITKEKAIDFFNEFGITSLRIDYGFSYTEIKTFSKHFQIILNASTITEETCTSLMKAGGIIMEIATDTPGFTVDEPFKHIGETLLLPEWLESKRSLIEAHLPYVFLKKTIFISIYWHFSYEIEQNRLYQKAYCN